MIVLFKAKMFTFIVLLTAFVAATWSGFSNAQGASKLPVGININSINYWTASMPFADAVRMGNYDDTSGTTRAPSGSIGCRFYKADGTGTAGVKTESSSMWA